MVRDYRYQQNFLRSPKVAAELIGHSNIRKSDLVYDLGAGSGVLSMVLAKRAGEVVAVESELRALKLLERNLQKHPNTKILKKDLLKVKLPSGPYKIFANIPFSLSSKVVQKFIFSRNPPESMYLIVQHQFAKKLVPSGNHFNSQLGASLWPWWSLRIRRPLRRSDFTPPPAVDTVLLEIKKLEKTYLDERLQIKYLYFVERCFSDQKYFLALPKDKAKISSEKKPSELTLDEWLRLFDQLLEAKN